MGENEWGLRDKLGEKVSDLEFDIRFEIASYISE